MRSPVLVLPQPRELSATSVFDALRRRRTTRAIAGTALPPELLSNLLWAACGVNRPEGPFGLPGLTAASASNSQEIDVYAAMAEAAYRYNAAAHALAKVTEGDLRESALTPGQRDIDARAPLVLIYVANVERLAHTKGFQEPGLHDPDVQKSYYFVDTGLIAGNVYLFAAAAGLATWFHNCDRIALGRKLNLSSSERVLFAQSVGYPAQH
jgi:nitroreductase